MTPSWEVLVGDCREVLATLPEQSVHTVVTSPPYFGLRDYGTGTWEGGDPTCAHVGSGRLSDAKSWDGTLRRGGERPRPVGAPHRGIRVDECGCGARRVDRQIGLEPEPEEYVEELVTVFREVRRVLRDDGTVWLNLGDSYASRWPSINDDGRRGYNGAPDRYRKGNPPAGFKPKDLIGIPWMVAFALRADGWYLRSDIVWGKPNPTPESVTDRPTRSHEFIFLLTKRPRYFYDHVAIRERDSGAPSGNGFAGRGDHRISGGLAAGGTEDVWQPGGGRNKRDVWTVDPDELAEFRAWKSAQNREKVDVWTISVGRFPDAHFATFPPDLIEPCIVAGAPRSACSECGAPWLSTEGARALDLSRPQARRALELADEAGLTEEHIAAIRAVGIADGGKAQVTQAGFGNNDPGVQALADEAKAVLGGYCREFLLARASVGPSQPSCGCEADAVPGVVMDPFNGAGTTGMAATRAGRSYVGIELSEEYAAMARERIATDVRLAGRAPQRGPKVPDGQASLLDAVG